MKEFKVGEIVKVQVIGSQHYGIFTKSLDDESYTGLIHISEISNDFVKDVNKFAKIDDIIYGTGVANSKKESEQEAAKSALEKLAKS